MHEVGNKKEHNEVVMRAGTNGGSADAIVNPRTVVIKRGATFIA